MKDFKLYLTLACLLLGIYLFIEYQRPQAVNWSPTYERTDKIPYGTYVGYHLLPDLFPKGIQTSRQSLYETLQQADGQHLLMISSTVNVSPTDYTQLKRYIQDGSSVFIAANNFNFPFLDSLKLRLGTRTLSFTKDSLSFHFTNPHLRPQQAYRFDRDIAASYFSRFDTSQASVLARNSKHDAVFLRYPIGKGNLYLLASPDFFTNYALLYKDNARFTSTALSYLSPDKALLYDEYQLLGAAEQGSVFRFLFRHDSLRWAYYIALACLMLFVLYEMKRRQRIIPIEDPLPNTSLEFAQVVAELYYQQHDNRDILGKKITYFLHLIRQRYRLKTGDLNEAFHDLLIKRSGANAETVRLILAEINAFYQGKYPSESELLHFNSYIDQFYEQSGITWNKNFLNNAPISTN